MNTIIENICEYSNNRIFSAIELLKIIEIIICRYHLEDYVGSIDFTNDNMIARYYYTSKKLCINYNNLVTNTLYYIENNATYYDFYEKVNTANLYILYILLHEISHIKQQKIIELNDSVESKILYISQKWEQHMKSNNLYNNKIYLLNPVERQANVCSVNQIMKLCNEKKSSNIREFFKKEFDIIGLKEYNMIQQQYPFMEFFHNYPHNEMIEHLILEASKKMNSFSRFNLGLSLTAKEYDELKLKLEFK